MGLGSRTEWDFKAATSSRDYILNKADTRKAIMDKRGYVALGNGRGQKERWFVKVHSDKRKASFRNDWRKWWLSAPGQLERRGHPRGDQRRLARHAMRALSAAQGLSR